MENFFQAWFEYHRMRRVISLVIAVVVLLALWLGGMGSKLKEFGFSSKTFQSDDGRIELTLPARWKSELTSKGWKFTPYQDSGETYFTTVQMQFAGPLKNYEKGLKDEEEVSVAGYPARRFRYYSPRNYSTQKVDVGGVVVWVKSDPPLLILFLGKAEQVDGFKRDFETILSSLKLHL
ncbi:MAG: hypothetical protein KC910_08745 [Candidatus Eremiobacteraeota bacterium]|nr:hypothetical protein [Candidatus Eremiobacteraeota bacterium]